MVRVLSVVLAMVMAATGACENSVPVRPAERKPSVVCTTGMIADAARAVAGERADVIALMGEGVDPHLYKPSPLDVRTLSDCDLIFYNGLHLEGKMGEILESLGRSKPVIAVCEHLDHSRLLAPAGGAGVHDPHVWFDVSLWNRARGVVQEVLMQFDPKHAEEYRERGEKYRKALDALDKKVQSEIAEKLPRAEQRVLITSHDAFHYFGKRYGFTVKGIKGVSTEAEASVKHLNDLVEFIVENKVKAVFVETSVNQREMKALIEGCAARGHLVRDGGTLFSDAMGKEGTPTGTYEGMIWHNVTTITKALE